MANKRPRDEEEAPRGIQLPGKLLDEIRSKEDKGDYQEDNSRYNALTKKRSKKDPQPVSRKDKRKEERKLKKQKRVGNKQVNHAQNRVQKDVKVVRLRPEKPHKTDEMDPMAALMALKKNKKKGNDIRIVKEADLDDEDDEELEEGFDGSDFEDAEGDFGDEGDFEGGLEDDDEDDFGGFDDAEDDSDAEEDPMAALAALKAKKAGKKPSSEVRVVKEDDLDDDASEGDFDDFEDAEDDEDEGDYDDFADYDDEDAPEDPLAQLKALKEKKNKVKEPSEDPLAQLKALKEKKKAKETSKADTFVTPQDRDLLQRDEDDMAFYAKKLGLKNGKRGKLTKTGEDDLVGGLLDGLDFFSGSEEEEGLGEEEDEENEFDDFEDSEEEASSKKENPYVAPTEESDEEQDTSEKGASLKYVPPALRRKMALESNEVSAEVRDLQRAIKGPLNKLSEANIALIVDEINGLYGTQPRHTVNENLISIILESIVQQGRLLDTFVYLHAALVVSIYRLQGVDFGAFFVQTLIEKFESYHKDAKGKETSNIVSLLSSVYTFQLVSSKLLYDIIKVLIGDLNEQNAELLLRLIRTSGNQMRSDDPTALKEIVLMVNKAHASLPLEENNTRMQFLVETISSLKNNKLKVHNESSHQLTVRLKKFLGTMNNRTTDPIQVTLDDIHNIETRGKWWLVGSAWKGAEKTEESYNKDVMNDILDNAEPNWMELARSQRMNTDIRRAIFVSIMSANDYVDAMTKLDKLALKRAQEREIPRVLIHCTGVEPAWNPYYGILASKLCDNHSNRKTFQFMLWDILKDFEGAENDDSEDEDFLGFDQDEDEEGRLKRILNLGRFFGFLIGEGSLPLHVLKTVNFMTASKDTKLFLEIIFVTFIDQVAKKSQVNSVGGGLGLNKMTEQKFNDKILIERLLKTREQPTLLRGIQFFLQDRVEKTDFTSGKKQKKRIQWGVGALHDLIDEFLRSTEE